MVGVGGQMCHLHNNLLMKTGKTVYSSQEEGTEREEEEIGQPGIYGPFSW